jgi:putative phosphoesterase
MVKIGVFSDVHNNLPALEAVLAALQQRGCSMFVCCGDLIGIGPYPEATVQRLMSIPNLIAVAGNHDRYLTEGLPSVFPNKEGMDEEEMLHHCWEHKQLSSESADYLKSLPVNTELNAEGFRICIALNDILFPRPRSLNHLVYCSVTTRKCQIRKKIGYIVY